MCSKTIFGPSSICLKIIFQMDRNSSKIAVDLLFSIFFHIDRLGCREVEHRRAREGWSNEAVKGCGNELDELFR